MESLLLVDENVADKNKGKEQSAGKGDKEQVDSLHKDFLLFIRSPQQPSRVHAAVIITGTVVGALGLAIG